MIPLNRVKQIIRISFIAIFAILSSVVIFNIVQRGRGDGRISEIVTKVDTLFLHDTLRIEKPIPKIIRDIDTFLVETKDTIKIKDTIYIKLPKEQKVYQGKNYQAWISGYRPELDSIHIFRNTQQIITSTTINSKQKRGRWGIGIHAGYGLTFQNNAIKPAPNIGFGLSYNLLIF
ncbi:MAG: hypothetical protein M0R37_11600 [Bacteroidales bacterium]|nr:hypothetical protein [Bacteroidales bacterium]